MGIKATSDAVLRDAVVRRSFHARAGNEHASTSGLLMLGTSFGDVFRENRPALHERAPVNGGRLILGTSFPRRVPPREPNFDDRRDLGTRSAFELDAPCVTEKQENCREGADSTGLPKAGRRVVRAAM
jgi:hypothetical protein